VTELPAKFWQQVCFQYPVKRFLIIFRVNWFLLTLIYAIHKPINEALDLYQEILCKIWKSLDRFEGRSAPETWAYRIALHTAINYKRNSFRRNRAWRNYGQDLQTKQNGGRGEDEILNEFAESLPEEDRKLFMLHLTELSYQEIAEISGISEPALRVRISRLKHQFEQRYL
jgi:RNA polymerase sigma-70 factor, ECF subfamily